MKRAPLLQGRKPFVTPIRCPFEEHGCSARAVTAKHASHESDLDIQHTAFWFIPGLVRPRLLTFISLLATHSLRLYYSKLLPVPLILAFLALQRHPSPSSSSSEPSFFHDVLLF